MPPPTPAHAPHAPRHHTNSPSLPRAHTRLTALLSEAQAIYEVSGPAAAQTDKLLTEVDTLVEEYGKKVTRGCEDERTKARKAIDNVMHLMKDFA